jgi:hypothetical protein
MNPGHFDKLFNVKVKVKVFTLQPALKAQRRSRSIALLFTIFNFKVICSVHFESLFSFKYQLIALLFV